MASELRLMPTALRANRKAAVIKAKRLNLLMPTCMLGEMPAVLRMLRLMASDSQIASVKAIATTTSNCSTSSTLMRVSPSCMAMPSSACSTPGSQPSR